MDWGIALLLYYVNKVVFNTILQLALWNEKIFLSNIDIFLQMHEKEYFHF